MNGTNLCGGNSKIPLGFWEPGSYKNTSRRIDEGYRLANDAMSMIRERADIEKSYIRNLKNWSKKWKDISGKSAENGTMLEAWNGFFLEAENFGTVREHVKQSLDGVVRTIKEWQKSTYQKTIGQSKERKEIEIGFAKAQKPWVKFLSIVEKTKGDYLKACKNHESLLEQKNSNLTQDNLKKIEERIVKSKDLIEKSKNLYVLAIQDLNCYSTNYRQDMSRIYEKYHVLEEFRLQFFKSTLQSIQIILSSSLASGLSSLYNDFLETINKANSDIDLKWWADRYGINTPLLLPKFEEFQPTAKENLFREEVCCEELNLVGEPVRVLYEYKAVDQDELSLEPGETFEKISEENETGWCTGRKNGKIGLYPARYAEHI